MTANNQYTKIPYMTLSPGETKFLRFVSDVVESVAVQCPNCGAWVDRAMATLATSSCDKCGAPLANGAVGLRRPKIEYAYKHTFIETPNGGKTSAVCIGDRGNVGYGLVEGTQNGFAKYCCPICDDPSNTATGRDGSKYQRRASHRGEAYAVEREVVVSTEYAPNGQLVKVKKSARDVMIVDENGITRPKIVVVEMPKKSFWEKIDNGGPYMESICGYDYMVSREGSGFDTVYTVERIGGYEVHNNAELDEYLSDIHTKLRNMGSLRRYQRMGYNPTELGSFAGFQSQPVQVAPAQNAAYAAYGSSQAPYAHPAYGAPQAAPQAPQAAYRQPIQQPVTFAPKNSVAYAQAQQAPAAPQEAPGTVQTVPWNSVVQRAEAVSGAYEVPDEEIPF